VPDLVTGGQDTVGLRVPNHPVALELLRAFGSGVAAPSANRFGRISPTTAAHVRQELGERVALILDGGACAVGLESTIVDLSRGVPVILRPGAIGADDIARVLGRRPRAQRSRGWERSGAGRHAPRVRRARRPLRAAHPARTRRHRRAGRPGPPRRRGAGPLRRARRPRRWRCVGQAPADPAGYGHDLYARLRSLDESGAARILVEAPPASPDWAAVADRLGRAAVGSGEDDET
jgi:L-threonylcarbamoyladenylate synthase